MKIAINIIAVLTMLVLVPIGFGEPKELQDWVLANLGISAFVFLYVYITGNWGWFTYFRRDEPEDANNTNLVLIEGLKLAILGVILNEKVDLYNQATIFLFVITTILASIIYYSAIVAFINFVNQEEEN